MPTEESNDGHEDVRARLAAEPTPRMPDDIAARLHATIERESRDRASATTRPDANPTPATVTPLRPRGRWKAPLLAAAGVVAVIAIAIPVINQTSDNAGGDAGSSTALSDDSANSGSRESGPTTQGDVAKSPGQDDLDSLQANAPELTRSAFADDVRTELVRTDLLPDTTDARLRSAVRCADGVPSGPDGRRVSLDDDPALVLAIRSSGVVAGTEVLAVVCGPDGPKVAARTTLPD